MTTKQMATDLNKKNGTTFVISGMIEKVTVDNVVGFKVFSKVPVYSEFGGVRNQSLNIANFYEFPKHVSHKILQNLDRKVRITIELVDDEDHLCQS